MKLFEADGGSFLRATTRGRFRITPEGGPLLGAPCNPPPAVCFFPPATDRTFSRPYFGNPGVLRNAAACEIAFVYRWSKEFGVVFRGSVPKDSLIGTIRSTTVALGVVLLQYAETPGHGAIVEKAIKAAIADRPKDDPAAVDLGRAAFPEWCGGGYEPSWALANRIAAGSPPALDAMTRIVLTILQGANVPAFVLGIEETAATAIADVDAILSGIAARGI